MFIQLFKLYVVLVVVLKILMLWPSLIFYSMKYRTLTYDSGQISKNDNDKKIIKKVPAATLTSAAITSKS